MATVPFEVADHVAPFGGTRGQGSNSTRVEVNAHFDRGVVHRDHVEAAVCITDQQDILTLTIWHRQQDAWNCCDGPGVPGTLAFGG